MFWGPQSHATARTGNSPRSSRLYLFAWVMNMYGIMRHMPRAVSVLHEKIRTAEGVVVEFKVWQVPKSKNYPEGVKYSFFAAHSGKVLVGYDNHSPKGHHRHFDEEEGSYDFEGFEKLREDFKKDLETALGTMR